MRLGPSVPRPAPTAGPSSSSVRSVPCVLSAIFKNQQKGLSTCFWGLFTGHRFVSSRGTVVAPSKTGSAKHSSNKSTMGLGAPARSGLPTACNGQPHQEAEGMARATESWLGMAGTLGVSACDDEAWRGHASKCQTLLSNVGASVVPPPAPLGWLHTGPGAPASQLSHALPGRWGSAWPSSPRTVPWLSTAPAGRAPWSHHPPRCSPRPQTG